MSKVLVEESNLSGIASAIRQKLGVQTTYKPGQMATAIGTIHGEPVLETLTANANGSYSPSTGKDGFSAVTVNVQNSYAAGDEGKVVSSGALVAQTARASAITVNGTYDTTNNNSVTVNVSGGSGGDILFGTSDPTSEQGNNGDTYVKYHTGTEVIVTVTGGYNGGAVVTVKINGTQVFTATASDTYNKNYNITQASVSTDIGTITIQITPPASNTGDLFITVTGPSNSETSNPPYNGDNTSYGYGNYSNTFYLMAGSGNRIAEALFIKQSGIWKGAGDVV